MAGTLTLLRWYRNAVMGELVAGPGWKKAVCRRGALGSRTRGHHSQSCCEHGEAGENFCEAQTVPPREKDSSHTTLHKAITMLSSGSWAVCKLCPGLSTQADFGGVSGGPGSAASVQPGAGDPGLQTRPPPTVSGQGCI